MSHTMLRPFIELTELYFIYVYTIGYEVIVNVY